MHKYLKIFIAVALLVLGIYFFNIKEPGWGAFCLVMIIIPVFLFFRNEYILLSMYQMQKQNIEKSAKWLSHIKNPSGQLIKSQEAYFYYMKGMLKAQEQNSNPGNVKESIKETEALMKKAIDMGLNEKHDLAAAKLNLAMAAISRGNKREAEALLAEAKKYDTAGMLTDQIKTINQQLKKPMVGNNKMQNPMYRNRGKFR